MWTSRDVKIDHSKWGEGEKMKILDLWTKFNQIFRLSIQSTYLCMHNGKIITRVGEVRGMIRVKGRGESPGARIALAGSMMIRGGSRGGELVEWKGIKGG